MGLITPTGTITLYKNVPFNQDYSHSIYFDSDTTEQETYFQGKELNNGKLTAQNYVKSENGKIKVQIAEYGKQGDHPINIDNASYMSWKNTDAGNNFEDTITFYAFITNVDMISINVVEITYQIDILQTYVMQDKVKFKQCFIDRRHYKTARTNPTVNLEPESIPIGKKLVSSASQSNTDLKLLGTGYNTLLVFTSDYIDYNEVYASEDESIAAWLGSNHGGVIQGCFVEVVKSGDRKDFLSYIIDHANKAEAIIGMMAVPDFLVNPTSPDKLLLDDDNAFIHTGSIDLSNWSSGMDGIAESDIKNKKLFTSPYNTLLLTDGSNQTELEFEYIGSYQDRMSDSVELQYDTVLSIQPDAQIQFLLKNYGKNGMTPNYNMLASLLLPNLQHVPWNSDAFSQWLANNGVAAGVNALTSIGSGAMMGMAAGGPAGAVLGAVGGGVMSLLGNAASAGTAAIKPPTVNGKSSAMPLMAAGEYDIHALRYSLSREDVERIDDYFTTFGYACNRLGNPFNSMKDVITGSGALNQCYIKTSACMASGDCPAEYLREIERIFNKGITWWKSGDVVGNYN